MAFPAGPARWHQVKRHPRTLRDTGTWQGRGQLLLNPEGKQAGSFFWPGAAFDEFVVVDSPNVVRGPPSS